MFDFARSSIVQAHACMLESSDCSFLIYYFIIGSDANPHSELRTSKRLHSQTDQDHIENTDAHAPSSATVPESIRKRKRHRTVIPGSGKWFST